MGQAKLRGTREVRVIESQVRKSEEEFRERVRVDAPGPPPRRRYR